MISYGITETLVFLFMNSKLSVVQEQILLGSLLGDGHLETGTQGRTYRYRVVQSTKKPLYFQFLYNTFQDFISTDISTRVYKTKSGESSTQMFTTQTSSVFQPYGSLFYNEKTKCVPKTIGNCLTPLSLAVWYMDDGSMKSSKSKGVYLNTHCFSCDEIDFLCEILGQNFGLKAWRTKDKQSFRIYISGKSYDHLRNLITPYFTDDMWYKWPLPRQRSQSSSILK